MEKPAVEICYEELLFVLRQDQDNCAWKHEEHEWKVMQFVNDKIPMPGLAICKKCALLETGWVFYKNKKQV